MEGVRKVMLTPKSTGKRKMMRIKRVAAFSQGVRAVSPTPISRKEVGKLREKKIAGGQVVTLAKKAKVEGGEIQIFYIEMLNYYSGKSVYYNYYKDIQMPKEAFCNFEAENLLTDEKRRVMLDRNFLNLNCR